MGKDDRPNSLLTPRMRGFVTGTDPVDNEEYEQKLRKRTRERVAHGLTDLALLTEHRENIDPLWIMMRGGTENIDGRYETVRDGWRDNDIHDLIPSLLTFVMDLSETFNYGPRDWEHWVKHAYETVNPGGYASVNIDSIPELDLNELERIFNGESDNRDRDDLRTVELTALLEHERIDVAEYHEAGGEFRTF